MIKLLKPLNRKGSIIPAGTLINLPEEMEKAMVAAKTAEKYVTQKEEPAKEEPKKDDPPDPAKALDKKYNRDPLAEAAKKAGVEFADDAKKAEIIAAVIEQGKADNLLNSQE